MTATPWLLLAVVACTPPADPPRPDTAPPDEARHVMTITPNMDLLFVIDDSGSMADKQNAFNRAFPSLLAQLAAADGGLPNLHLGVVSTDLGTSASGSGMPAPSIGQVGAGGCAATGKAGNLTIGTASVAGTFLRVSRNGTDNFAGTIPEAFDAMATLGNNGCGFEQQLGAMKMALDANTANAGFLRANANLGVIVLTDEDDCSVTTPGFFAPTGEDLGNLDSFRCTRHGVECAEELTSVGVKTQCKPRAASPYVSDVAPFRDFLVGLKAGDAHRVMFGAIIAEPTTVAVETRMLNGLSSLALARACTYPTAGGTMAVADPAVRLAALASSLPRSAVTSICNDDLTAQATQLGQSLKALVNDHCLPETFAGLATCTLTDHLADGTTEAFPAELVDDASCARSQQRVRVLRTAPPAFDTYSTLSCAPASL